MIGQDAASVAAHSDFSPVFDVMDVGAFIKGDTSVFAGARKAQGVIQRVQMCRPHIKRAALVARRGAKCA